MKRNRTICPIYKEETSTIEEPEDTNNYQETIRYQRCSYHPISPEEKLPNAIFNQGGNQWPVVPSVKNLLKKMSPSTR
jgi:hypothetical protein